MVEIAVDPTLKQSIAQNANVLETVLTIRNYVHKTVLNRTIMILQPQSLNKIER